MSLLLKILIALLGLLIILIVGAFFYAKYQIYAPLDKQGTPQNFSVESGQGVEQIAANLEKEKIIRRAIWFNYYIWYRGWVNQLQAGDYKLSPSMTIPEIALMVVNGEVAFHEIKITIPEGFILKQIDARLAAVGLIKLGELLQQPELEGYLFPDTYIFDKKAALEEIIKKMQDNFDKKITAELKEEIARQNKTLEEIIIMASILEKEVASDEDRRIVSGIFWKRLANNYPLESCATIAYVLNIDKWRYSFNDTRVDSPYNTYLHPGLPPTAINNPGLSTIKAAIYPIKTDYLFFLSAPDGQTIYSKTLEEHNQNKVKYLK